MHLPVQTAVLVVIATITATAQQAETTPVAPRVQPAARQMAAEDAVNYSIRIEWRQGAAAARHLEVLAAEGTVTLDTILPEKVKIDDNEIPVTVKLRATLHPVNKDKARLELFLGRTIPYVTSTYSASPGQRSSSFQQMSVGLSANVVVVFGKAIVVQSDGNESVSLLVKRVEP